MTILLTGAAGLMGKQLRRALPAAGRLIAVDLVPPGVGLPPEEEVGVQLSFDLRDPAAVYEVFHRHAVEAVVHAAAISHPGPSYRHPVTTVQVNFDATVLLLEAARLYGIKRFIFISSIGVYGAYQRARVDEDHPLAGNSPYGVAKIAAELMGRMYARTYGLSFVALRYGHIYGPDRRLACPVKLLVESAVGGADLTLASGWDARLNLIYQRDLAAPVLACLQRDPPSTEYNIGDGAVHTLGEIARLLQARFPRWNARIGRGPLPREVAGLPPEEGGEEGIDISRAKAELGFAPRFGLREGLEDYLETILR